MEIAYRKKDITEHVINLSKTKSKIMDFTQKFNNKKDLRDKERLKPAIQQTLFRIVYLLAKHYVNPSQNWFLQKQNINGKFLSEQDLSLPHTKSYIANYNQEKGNEFKNISLSTVRNHIKKLEYFGLIKQVKANSKTLLIVHQELLAFNDNFDHLNDHFVNFFSYPLENLYAENKGLQEKKAQSLHPKYPNLETIKSITVCDVENLNDSSKNNTDTFYLDTQQAKNRPQGNEEQKEKVAPKRKSKRDLYIQQAVIRLWIWIEANLYAGQYDFISESQKDIAIEYLEQCFNNSPKSAVTVYSSLKDRLEMWKKWKNRKFTSLPSSFFVHGNPHGFDQTKNWVTKRHEKQLKSKMKAKAKNHFRKFVRIMEDKQMDHHTRNKTIQGLHASMNRLRTKYPYLFEKYSLLVNNYLNKSHKDVA